MDYKELIELYYRNELNESQAKELEDYLSSDEEKMREFLQASHEDNAIREALRETADKPQKSGFKLLSPKFIIPAAAALMIISSTALMLTCDKKETNGALLGTSHSMTFPLNLTIQKLDGKKILELKLRNDWGDNYRLSLKNTDQKLADNKILFTLAPKSSQARKPEDLRYIISADCFKLEADFDKGGAALNIDPGAKTKFTGISPTEGGWLIEYQ
jgi:hypothetical protein